MKAPDSKDIVKRKKSVSIKIPGEENIKILNPLTMDEEVTNNEQDLSAAVMKVDENEDKDPKNEGDFEEVAIFVAAEKGDAATIIQLKAGGAKMNTLRADGQRPIHIAAREGHVEAVAALLDAGADAQSWSKKGTALMQAQRAGTAEHLEIVALLENHLKQYPNGIKGIKPAIRKNTPILNQFRHLRSADKDIATETACFAWKCYPGQKMCNIL